MDAHCTHCTAVPPTVHDCPGLSLHSQISVLCTSDSISMALSSLLPQPTSPSASLAQPHSLSQPSSLFSHSLLIHALHLNQLHHAFKPSALTFPSSLFHHPVFPCPRCPVLPLPTPIHSLPSSPFLPSFHILPSLIPHSLQFSFGVPAPIDPSSDPIFQTPCLAICPTAAAAERFLAATSAPVAVTASASASAGAAAASSLSSSSVAQTAEGGQQACGKVSE